MQNKNSFLGKGWAFPPEFSHNDNPTRMFNYEEDIRQSLIILLSTRTGERIHRPDSIQDGILIIELYYTIRMNNVQQELTYPIYFDSNR